MSHKKDLGKPEVGEEPKFIDQDLLESFFEHIDDIAGTVFENPDEAVAYLRDFFTRNFGQDVPTYEERMRKQREAKEAKLAQQA